MEHQPEESPFEVPEDDVPESEEPEEEGEHSPPPELQDETDG